MIPLDLLKEYLKKLDEVQLCELLDLSSEELVEFFEERIHNRRAYLEKEVEFMYEYEEAKELNFDDDNELIIPDDL